MISLTIFISKFTQKNKFPLYVTEFCTALWKSIFLLIKILTEGPFVDHDGTLMYIQFRLCP